MSKNLKDSWQQQAWDSWQPVQRRIVYLASTGKTDTQVAHELMISASIAHEMKKGCLSVRFRHTNEGGLEDPLPVFHELADERTAAIGKPLEINPFILAKLKLLTAQERKIAEELSIGRNFREIGRSHNMNESQVREIKSVILQKTGVFTRSHLADLFAAELQQQVHETLTASR